MSKITKLMKSPKRFFYDAWKKDFEPKPIPKPIPKPMSQEKRNEMNKNKFKEIEGLSYSYAVNSIKVDDEYIWPYLRSHLWMNLNLIYMGKSKVKAINPYAIQLGHKDHLPFLKREEFAKKYDVKEIVEIKEGSEEIDFLFVTSINAGEQVLLKNKKIYYRLADTLLELAMKFGTTKKLEMVKINTLGLHKVRSYVHKPLLVFTPLIKKSGFFEKVNLHRSFYPLFNLKVKSQSLNQTIMHDIIDWEMHSRDYYIDLLGRLKPKVIFFNGFHYYAPLISAADLLGIVTVDLQHGIQVGWNPLYNSWDEIPKEGYQSLPDYFAVWGQKEYNNINEVFQGEKHHPIIIGNPWFEKQKNEKKEMSNKFNKKIKNYKIKILVPLQTQFELPKLLLDIIDISPSDIVWIIRHHPKGNKFKLQDFHLRENDKSDTVQFDNVLLSEEIDNAEWSQLLQHIDVTISEGSTLALEADSYGSYNILFGEAGKDNYIQEIENNMMFFIESQETFYDIINNLDYNNKQPKINAFEKIDINIVFQTFIEKYHEKQNILS